MFRTQANPTVAQTVADIHYLPSAPVFETDSRYLSFSIDISVLAGGYWWEGSMNSQHGLGALRIPPLNLERRRLNRFAAALGPAYLRIGGSEADKIHYFDPPENEPNALVLSRRQWDAVHAFTRRHGLGLMFTCKYGLFNRAHHGHWDGRKLETLLQYSCERGYQIDVFELGNELNAYWAFHGLRSQPGPKNLASDYETFSELVRRYYPQARICGPGSAFWPRLGETIKPFTNITPRFLATLEKPLDIIDWHYYPFQSERSPVKTRAARIQRLVDPKSFEAFSRYSQRLARLRNQHMPGAELWTGETGSAQCGGQPYFSDRWASCFWWADQLGLGASLGQRVMVRQALIGGDYGMIDRLALKARPDYWLSWLWQKLMGPRVYQVQSSDPALRAYLHSDRSGTGFTLLLINLHPTEAFVNVSIPGRCRAIYVMTGNRLDSRKVRINGIKPDFRKGKVSLEDFSAQATENPLPAHSISFWQFDLVEDHAINSCTTHHINKPT